MNRHIILSSRPIGIPVDSDFQLESRPLPRIRPGEFLVQPVVYSMDPAIRGFLDDRPSYLPPVELGQPVNGMLLGKITESSNVKYPVGCFVRALGTWSEYCVMTEQALGLEIVKPVPGVPLEHYMGALGPVGLTAWIGLLHIGKAKAGDVVTVSAAAGATGSTVGQIAKIRGCKVIGLVGSPAKAAAIVDLGFDAAINYRNEPDLALAVQRVAPDGIDVFFDNVGGEILETILPLMRPHGRVAVCGMIGDYNDQDRPYGVKTLWQLVVNRVSMQGFLTYDYPELLAQAQADLDAWFGAGQLKPLENIRLGFENIPAAFIDLMSGRTTGKTLVKI
jgi:NADPH-dependent curcumin reductase CurA